MGKLSDEEKMMAVRRRLDKGESFEYIAKLIGAGETTVRTWFRLYVTLGSDAFHQKLLDNGMIQSMSRVGKCIDNGPMEGFWGILKRERYYKHKFTSREKVVQMINEYIDYYNNKRYQRRLGVLTPMEKHAQYSTAA